MGVILFEMLVGYPPFASETPRETWFKIQNWRKYLQIPSDAKVSPQAADLIRYSPAYAENWWQTHVKDWESTGWMRSRRTRSSRASSGAS
jgi:serine/threonine protein kinase